MSSNLSSRNMKQKTCAELGGSCELVFTASTIEEMAVMAQQHGMEMFQVQDASHLEAMQNMQKIMQTPDGFQKWFEEKKKQFAALPDID